MARKGKKRSSTAKRYYGYRRYKTMGSYDYFRAKIEWDSNINFPGVQGDIQFAANGNSIVAFGDILAGSPHGTGLRQIFPYWRVTGVKVLAVPTIRNMNVGGQIVFAEGVYLAVTWGVIPAVTVSMVKALNNSIVLNPITATSTYVSGRGEQANWHATGLNAENPPGGVIVVSPGNLTTNQGPVWHVKIDMYVMFKKSNL